MSKAFTDADRKWISERSTQIMEAMCEEKYGKPKPGCLIGLFAQGFIDGLHVASMRQALAEWQQANPE